MNSNNWKRLTENQMSSKRHHSKSNKLDSDIYQSYNNEDSDVSQKKSKTHKKPTSISTKKESNHKSVKNSQATDSIYTYSFHEKVSTPIFPGPPPLKRVPDISSDEIEEDDVSFDKNVYNKPEWIFPYKKISRNQDEPLYDALKDKFSVKNVVSQLKIIN